VNALANEEVGEFVNTYFVSSFQKVGTFKIAGTQKQGGNVAAYFCAPDGRVLHVIAGPVDARRFLEEAKWVVLKTKDAIAASKDDVATFKKLLRKSHAERLLEEHGIRVTPVLKDQGVQDLATALSYRDAEGRRLAPVLPLPPIENPGDVRRQLSNAAKVHQLMAAHATMKIENIYGAIFQGILNEKVTTKPVEIDRPFSWRK
jgi:hypothetical protein